MTLVAVDCGIRRTSPPDGPHQNITIELGYKVRRQHPAAMGDLSFRRRNREYELPVQHGEGSVREVGDRVRRDAQWAGGLASGLISFIDRGPSKHGSVRGRAGDLASGVCGASGISIKKEGQ
jgi:hypothetical protein